jgi:P-type Cu2+ transporter
MVATVYCVHCGAVAKHPVTKMIHGQPLIFCCGGCVQVYELMHEEELDSGWGGTEATSIPHPEAAHLAATQPEQSASSQTISFHVAGMSCANCVATVERQLHTVPGVLEVRVILETERATVKMISNKGSIADLQRVVKKAGYELIPESGA